MQTYTNPKTGITSVVGNSVSAKFTNSVSLGVAALAGTTVGYQLSSSVGKALGGGVVGRTVGAAVGTAVAGYTTKAVNNAMQSILNPATGAVSQVLNQATGSIKNVIGSITGSGKYDPSKPDQNIVSRVPDGLEGGTVTTYKDGTRVLTDANGTKSVISGSDPQNGSTDLGLGTRGLNQSGSQDNSSANQVGGTVTDGNGNPVYTDYDQGIQPNQTSGGWDGTENAPSQSEVDYSGGDGSNAIDPEYPGEDF